MKRRSFLVVASTLLTGGTSVNTVDTIPIRPAVFEGAKEGAMGLTLRFGNGLHHNEIVFTGVKPLSVRSVRRLTELTGTDASSDEILNALTL